MHKGLLPLEKFLSLRNKFNSYPIYTSIKWVEVVYSLLVFINCEALYKKA